jgi:glycosyltransferase involved in cell wall biosynthesis
VYRIRSSMQRVPWLFSGSERQYAPPFPDPEAMLTMRRIILHERPEIIHAHNWLIHSFLPLKAWSGAQLIVTLHNFSLVCAKMTFMYHKALCNGHGLMKCLDCAVQYYGLAKGIPIVLSHQLMGLAERGAVDMFLAVSQAVAVGNGLVGSRLPFQVIPNFILDDVGVPRGDAQPYLEQLPGDDYLLFVGVLGRMKGVDVLLRAYADLTDAPPLVLIGHQAPDWPILPLDRLHNVFVLKDWPHYAIMEAWRRSIMALVPSVVPEACSTVVMEAMSAGRPVIASRIGGMIDLVADRETGFLVQPGNPSELRQAIEQLLANPHLRSRMGQASLRKVVEFQASTVVPRIEHVYQEMLQQKVNPSRRNGLLSRQLRQKSI